MIGLQKDNPLISFPGNIRVKRVIYKAFCSGQLSNAILLAGPSGSGKFAQALSLAKLFLCPKKGCGSCEDCLSVANLNHPDLQILIPTTKEENPLEKPEKYARILAEKAKNPYYMPQYSSKPTITIDSIRGFSSWLSLTPTRGLAKVGIIVEADKMNEEAQNAFLKTLEEPPLYARIILTSANFEELLPTILSRVERFLFTQLTKTETLEYLMKISNKPHSELELIAAIANGNLRQAIELLDDKALKARDEKFKLFLALFNETELELLKWLLKNKEFPLDEILESFSSFARDTIMLALNDDTITIINFDKMDELMKIAKKTPVETLFRLVRSIEEAMRNMKSYINPTIQLLHIYNSIHKG